MLNSRLFSARVLAMVAGGGLGAAAARAQSAETIEVRPSTVVDPDAIEGTYHQPQWTAHRLFTNSRAYVLEEDQIEVEAWWKNQNFHDSVNNYQLYQQEVEFGLGHRLQLDLYVNEQNYYNPDKGSRMNDLEGQQIEMRYAFADWGKLPLNPTLYLEYHPIKNMPERAEVRVLLADNLAPNLHFAMNIGYEQDLWGKKENDQPELEVPVDLAISSTALCKQLAIGLEVKNEWQHHPAYQPSGVWQQEIDVGPAFQWRPTKALHVDVTPLIGVHQVDKDVSPKYETWVIVGYDV